MLPEVRGERGVEPRRLEEPAGIRAVVARRHLDEGAPGVGRHAVDLGEERPADSARSKAGAATIAITASEVIVLLEARKQMNGDEPESLSISLCDPDQRPNLGKALQAADDIAGPAG